MNNQTNTNLNGQPQKRVVSFPLGLGIFFFPLIFAWFTLRQGHSTLAKVLSFGWLILGLLFFYSVGSSTPNADSTSTSTQPTVAEAPQEQQVIQVSANDLYRHYEANEVAADKQFKGQLLEVTGIVEKIDSGISDGANVHFKVGDQYSFNNVTASGDDTFDNFAATLSKGNKITIRCIGAGEVIGSPFLKKCVAQ